MVMALPLKITNDLFKGRDASLINCLPGLLLRIQCFNFKMPQNLFNNSILQTSFKYISIFSDCALRSDAWVNYYHIAYY